MLYRVTNLFTKKFSSFTSNNKFFSWLPCNVKFLTIFIGFAFLDWKHFFEFIIEVKSSYNAFFVKENTTNFTICNFLTRRYVIISSDVVKVLEPDNLTSW